MSGAIIAAAEFVKALQRASAEEREQAWAIVRAVEPKSERRIAAGRANAAKRWQQDGNGIPLPPNHHAGGNAESVGNEKHSAPNRQAVASGLVAGGTQGGSLSSSFSSSSEPQNEAVTGSTAREAATTANPAAIVDWFVDGVNRKVGGTWPTPTGKPYRDLARALDLQVAQHRCESPLFAPMAHVRLLGVRWVAYCEGKPRHAMKAADWLGEGAPESPPPARRGAPKQANPPDAPWLKEPDVAPWDADKARGVGT